MQDFLAEGSSLDSFKDKKQSVNFKIASNYPQFFDQYLKDNDRIINVFIDDPNANQRIFYFQYLKLCYEAQIKDAKILIQNIRDLIFNPDFYFVYDLDLKQQNNNDYQYKRLIFEFMELIEERKYGIFQLLDQYSIMDRVFVCMLRSLLFFYGKAESIDEYIDREIAFSTFEEIFGLQIQKFGNCIKFVDADVFAYEENCNQVYMAYITGNQSNFNEKNQEIMNSQNIDSHHGSQQNVMDQLKIDQGIQKVDKKKNQIYMSQASSIYDFIDYTASQDKNNRQKSKNALNISEQNSACYLEQKSLENSADLGLKKPFQQAQESKKKMTTSGIDISNVYQSAPTTLDDNLIKNYNQLKNKKVQFKGKKEVSVMPTQSTISEKKDQDIVQANKPKQMLSKQFDNQSNNVKSIPMPSIENISQKKIISQFQFEKIDTFIPKYVARDFSQQSNFKSQQYMPSLLSPTKNTEINANFQRNLSPGPFEYANKCQNLSKFRLNITKEFTNSRILDVLPPTQSNNIRIARSRAREYRKTIRHLL